MKKVFKGVIISLLSLIIVVCVVGFFLFSSRIFAVNSVKELEKDLYTLEFRGNYGLDELLAQGGANNPKMIESFFTSFLSYGMVKANDSEEPSEDLEPYACSSISVNNGDEKLFGRNFDWPQECCIMIIRTYPKNGYSSISTTNLNFLEFGSDWQPVDFTSKMMALASIYIPVDGINEKGLVIADLTAGDDVPAHQDNGKADITTTIGIRLILDKAATVDEAISLLEQYDMHSDLSIAHHYAISDLSGKSVVVEYVDGQMYVKETQTVANHNLTDNYKCGMGSENSHYRQSLLDKAIEDNNGVLDEKAVLEAINSSSNPHTRWQILYNQSKKEYSLYLDRTHENPFKFSL